MILCAHMMWKYTTHLWLFLSPPSQSLAVIFLRHHKTRKYWLPPHPKQLQKQLKQRKIRWPPYNGHHTMHVKYNDYLFFCFPLNDMAAKLPTSQACQQSSRALRCCTISNPELFMNYLWLSIRRLPGIGPTVRSLPSDQKIRGECVVLCPKTAPQAKPLLHTISLEWISNQAP